MPKHYLLDKPQTRPKENQSLTEANWSMLEPRPLFDNKTCNLRLWAVYPGGIKGHLRLDSPAGPASEFVELLLKPVCLDLPGKG